MGQQTAVSEAVQGREVEAHSLGSESAEGDYKGRAEVRAGPTVLVDSWTEVAEGKAGTRSS